MWALHGTKQCRCFHAAQPSRPSIKLRPICTSGGSATSQKNDACVVSSAESHITRRQLALSAFYLSAAASVHPPRAATATESQAKRKHLHIEKLKDIIAEDFQEKQYYITGNLTKAVFDEQCSFIDPTTNVTGPEKYSKAVAALFDPSSSKADLISIQVADDHTITSRWRFDAAINIPGKPRIKPYTGSTKYVINSDGLVQQHIETWDISALDAFVSLIFPSFGAPPAPPVQAQLKAESS